MEVYSGFREVVGIRGSQHVGLGAGWVRWLVVAVVLVLVLVVVVVVVVVSVCLLYLSLKFSDKVKADTREGKDREEHLQLPLYIGIDIYIETNIFPKTHLLPNLSVHFCLCVFMSVRTLLPHAYMKVPGNQANMIAPTNMSGHEHNVKHICNRTYA